MRVIRVFPRRTKATPVDELAVVGPPRFWDEADRVQVSVTFTWDLPEAERLAEQWEHVAPVSLGGPACGTRGEEFEPGRYVKPGYVITSRGCPNRCWFCNVWRRDGSVRELPIKDGFNVLDDNLLACSRQHIERVFDMLARQPIRPMFTGGLEAARLRRWHAEALAELKPQGVYLAYDTADDWEPLRKAVETLRRYGPQSKGHWLRCYVLIGYPRDTMVEAEERLQRVVGLGVMPFAMLWRNDQNATSPEWRKFQRYWIRPHAVGARMGTESSRAGGQ